MFQRFHEMRERSERGFTLIELLVVILIIAILAAIAIPVFLNQRKKGWASQLESSLKNAATSIETIATEENGDYTKANGDVCDEVTACAGGTLNLDDYGYNGTTDVVLTVRSADATSYCIEADHNLDTDTQWYSSDTGTPSETTCVAGP